MIINVTQSDIDNGKPGTDSSCPIALAIKRQTGQDWVSVVLSNVEFAQKKGGIFHYSRIDLPDEATKFILDFDARLDVEPFSFELEECNDS